MTTDARTMTSRAALAYQAGLREARLGHVPELRTTDDLADEYGADYVRYYFQGVRDERALASALGRA